MEIHDKERLLSFQSINTSQKVCRPM